MAYAAGETAVAWFGVGKTTLVSAVSEIRPLRTEERLSEIGAAVDDLTGVGGKTTTTVALDFGRITINSEVVSYLFGTQGQDRFWSCGKNCQSGGYEQLFSPTLADWATVSGQSTSSSPVTSLLSSRCFEGADVYETDEVCQGLTSARMSRFSAVTPATGAPASKCWYGCWNT